MKIAGSGIILFFSLFFAHAQDNLPVLKSNNNVLKVKVNGEIKINRWLLNASLNPDTYKIVVERGKTTRVTFVSDINAISFNVVLGQNYDFFVEYKSKKYYTRIVGVPPAAVFNSEYQRKRKGKVSVEIPEVYELVVIGFALLDGYRFTREDTKYYGTVRKYFDKYKNHAFVKQLDVELKNDRSRYFSLKNNAYSFKFSKNGKIVQSRIYDRIRGFSENSIRPYVKLIQSFSDETNFREFYANHKSLYEDQIQFFHKSLNIKNMLRWLGIQFPDVRAYDTYKIIFPPLVGGNQNVVWLESNGFRELQPHVEYPYRNLKGVSFETNIFFKGTILFTELNHGFLNPTSFKYAKEVARATSNRNLWVAKEKGPRYYRGNSLFNEYINWVLLNLRTIDIISDRQEQEKLINYVDRIMVKDRGFIQFDKFSKFLVNEYRKRKSNTTVADMYPKIIAWFDKLNKESLKHTNVKK